MGESECIKIVHPASGRETKVLIEDRAIRAIALQEIKIAATPDAPHEGLVVLDESFRNTAPVKSQISHLYICAHFAARGIG